MTKRVLIFNASAEWYVSQLQGLRDRYSFVPATSVEEALAQAGDAEVLVALAPRIPLDLVAAMPRLEWIHALTTGYENLLAMDCLAPEVAISNSRGIHGPQVAELAILVMMALQRRFPAMVRNQARARWERWEQPLLLGKTLCIVGVGTIGEALAARAGAFGMEVVGVSDGRAEVEGFARIHPRRAIGAAASAADFVVVVVPHTPETHHIINDAVLEAMKPGAYLVNIARGGCVDEAALTAHLEHGSIAGAALDVFEREPLPEESPFWSLPNVIVTPHVGGMSDIYHEQVLPILAQNLDAYAHDGAAGLVNRVER